MAKIYVSGSTGFVGKNLVRYLTARGFTLEELNLREKLQPDVFNSAGRSSIVHLAGKAHDLKNTSVANQYFDVNFELTKQLFELFLTSRASKFIFISSVKAVADKVDGKLTEEYLPSPATDYGKSKLMAEEYILSQKIPQGKSCFILRPCMIHGPGNKGNLNLLYKLVAQGIPYPLAGFDNNRSFLGVGNLCFVINELIERDDIPSGIYNVADDETISTNELVSLIAKSLNKCPRLWKVNPGFIKAFAKLGDLLKLPFTTERLNKLTESYIVDNSKIKSALKKEFPQGTRENLFLTIQSFLRPYK